MGKNRKRSAEVRKRKGGKASAQPFASVRWFVVAFDFKKEYKEFYVPARKPTIVEVPPMNYLAVRGCGDPNAEDGEYKRSIGLLYSMAYTIKMSKMGDHRMDGYFDFVVPPLEGFWWQVDAHGVPVAGIDYAHKETFQFISAIRLPDFVTPEEFEWARAEATCKKQLDFSSVELLPVNEGLCVQCLHVGPYDDELATIAVMHEFALKAGYDIDITEKRLHHEIYLSDARKVAPEKLKTVVRHPVKKM